ncbi:uncharacterized protein LOC103516321 [Diaphorina citri]|uniref:Uncharacterized protein LOC103516321 n=1 Tax=Diaphorina citri TaxID=121845 RepID=A0A3Q0J7U9_DIACI|nr:uncharacterized protein LOC103516321 [Diaphorina citri]
MFDEDDFEIEDVDLPHYNGQSIGNTTQKNQSCSVSSPQRKVTKKHELDFVHSIIEQSSEEESSITPNNIPQKNNNILTGSKNVNEPHRCGGQVTKRKFPGPAGLLPERATLQPINSNNNLSSNLCANNSRDKHDIELASSQYSSVCETIAWKCAIQDIRQSSITGIQKFNISHLKRAAFSSKSKALKYPFLVAAVSNMDTGQELFVTLRDTSGDIQAYVNSEVLEQFPVELRRGSVILLKKVGVLKSGQARGIYLLITPNNLAVIYPPDEGTSRLSEIKSTCQDIDFTDLDGSLNTSLDISLNTSSSIPQLHRTPTPNLESRSRSNHSTPNSYQQKQFAKMNAPPRTSTPNVPLLSRNRIHSTNQPSSSNQMVSPSSSRIFNKPAISQSGSNVSFQPQQSLNNLSHSKLGTKLDSGSVSVSVLSQNGVNKGEDLSTTVNNLFEGLDTDSIFGDF